MPQIFNRSKGCLNGGIKRGRLGFGPLACLRRHALVCRRLDTGWRHQIDPSAARRQSGSIGTGGCPEALRTAAKMVWRWGIDCFLVGAPPGLEPGIKSGLEPGLLMVAPRFHLEVSKGGSPPKNLGQ